MGRYKIIKIVLGLYISLARICWFFPAKQNKQYQKSRKVIENLPITEQKKF